VRERCNPVNLIKRSLLLDAGLAGSAAYVLVRYLRRKRSGRGKEKAPAASPGLFDSMLSVAAGAAGRALPGLVASWLDRGCSRAAQPHG